MPTVPRPRSPRARWSCADLGSRPTGLAPSSVVHSKTEQQRLSGKNRPLRPDGESTCSPCAPGRSGGDLHRERPQTRSPRWPNHPKRSGARRHRIGPCAGWPKHLLSMRSRSQWRRPASWERPQARVHGDRIRRRDLGRGRVGEPNASGAGIIVPPTDNPQRLLAEESAPALGCEKHLLAGFLAGGAAAWERGMPPVRAAWLHPRTDQQRLHGEEPAPALRWEKRLLAGFLAEQPGQSAS